MNLLAGNTARGTPFAPSGPTSSKDWCDAFAASHSLINEIAA